MKDRADRAYTCHPVQRPDGSVTCSRCGSLMRAEVLYGEAWPTLRWRCDVGHVTQSLPLTARLTLAAGPVPAV